MKAFLKMSKGISIFLHFKSIIKGLGSQDIETEVSPTNMLLIIKLIFPQSAKFPHCAYVYSSRQVLSHNGKLQVSHIWAVYAF